MTKDEAIKLMCEVLYQSQKQELTPIGLMVNIYNALSTAGVLKVDEPSSDSKKSKVGK